MCDTCEVVFGAYKRQCHFSPGVREFVNSLLQVDPARRPTAIEAQRLAWVAEPAGPKE